MAQSHREGTFVSAVQKRFFLCHRVSVFVFSSGEMMSENDDRAMDYGEIEKELAAFEAEERKRLGIEQEQVQHWHDPNPQGFTRDERETTTILLGGLTLAHDTLL